MLILGIRWLNHVDAASYLSDVPTIDEGIFQYVSTLLFEKMDANSLLILFDVMTTFCLIYNPFNFSYQIHLVKVSDLVRFLYMGGFSLFVLLS